MWARVMMSLSAALPLVFGLMHLAFTFFGPKFLPRDPGLRVRMSEVSPVISKDTSMWRAWVGFNASHSMGLILFGLVYGYLAVARPEVLFGSLFLRAVGVVTLVGYLVLAKTYWFSVPLLGTAASLTLYLAAIFVGFD